MHRPFGAGASLTLLEIVFAFPYPGTGYVD